MVAAIVCDDMMGICVLHPSLKLLSGRCSRAAKQGSTFGVGRENHRQDLHIGPPIIIALAGQGGSLIITTYTVIERSPLKGSARSMHNYVLYVIPAVFGCQPRKV